MEEVVQVRVQKGLPTSKLSLCVPPAGLSHRPPGSPTCSPFSAPTHPGLSWPVATGWATSCRRPLPSPFLCRGPHLIGLSPHPPPPLHPYPTAHYQAALFPSPRPPFPRLLLHASAPTPLPSLPSAGLPDAPPPWPPPSCPPAPPPPPARLLQALPPWPLPLPSWPAWRAS